MVYIGKLAENNGWMPEYQFVEGQSYVFVTISNSILCGLGGEWAISVTGGSRPWPKTEIAFPHEPHILFFLLHLCLHRSQKVMLGFIDLCKTRLFFFFIWKQVWFAGDTCWYARAQHFFGNSALTHLVCENLFNIQLKSYR